MDMFAHRLAVVDALEARLARPPELIQIVVGPRQVGKTTAAREVLGRWAGPCLYGAADLPLPPGPEWIEAQWEAARRAAGGGPALLVLDEVQKVPGWGETVKALWDADRAAGRSLKVVLLGSSALLLTRGAAESLAGRFFLHRCTHWTWPECREAFGWDLDRWLYFGGYPGAAPLADDEPGWRSYVADSLIETVVARDVLGLQSVAKPALLRNLFVLSAQFPAQILSYTKMLGQLHDAGNTTTLAGYLRLLGTAFLVTGLERHSPGAARSRGSSPKLVVRNNALVNALGLRSYEETRRDMSRWGRLVENAVGAHLVNNLQGVAYDVTYWRERNDEVDYVVQTAEGTWAIEVKSGLPGKTHGLAAFLRRQPHAHPLIVGSGGLPLADFFAEKPERLFVRS